MTVAPAGRALVTGATGGLGGAVVRHLRAAGYGVLATGRDAQALAALAAPGVEVLASDLRDPAARSELVAAAGDVDVLVAAAAEHGSGPVELLGPEAVTATVEVNLVAPMAISAALLPAMLARGRGHLVLVSSLAGLSGFIGAAPYSASKFGLRGFAQSLRQDLDGTGVSVSVLFPGFIGDAGMLARAGRRPAPWVPTSTADEVAAAVVRSIEHPRPELVVAPWRVRALFAALGPFPGATQALTRRAVASLST